MELELKYIAADDDVLERLARLPRIGPARLDVPRTASEVDRYLDTPYRRLETALWACRLRTRNGRTIVSLKGPAGEAAADEPSALHRRPEVEAPAAPTLDPKGWPRSPARDRLAALAGDEPLEERLRLEQLRTERGVLLDGRGTGEEQRIGLLSIDRVEMWRGEARLGRLRVVELELDQSAAIAAGLVGELDRALRAVDGLVSDPHTKLEHALSAAAEIA